MSPSVAGRTLAGVTTYVSAGHEIRFAADRTHVMGVINVSPESKNRDTYAAGADAAAAMAHRYREAGATIIDLGAQSSVRGNLELPPDEEIARLRDPLRRLVGDGHIVSVDTWKPEVARAAVAEGAAIINDTGGMRRPEMVALAAAAGVVAVVMHLEGDDPLAVGELDTGPEKAARTAAGLGRRIDELAGLGVTQVITDPGIGITYATDYDEVTRQQLAVVRDLGHLVSLGPPVLVPIPRKAEPARVAAFITLALERGAGVLRVHDVDVACDLVGLFGRSAA